MPQLEDRITYTDVLIRKNGPRTEMNLDWMAARYLNLQENISRSTVFMIGADTEFRPERISFKFYNTVGWWWVICMFNGVVNPLEDLYAGREILIPDINDVHKFLELSKVSAAPVTGTIKI